MLLIPAVVTLAEAEDIDDDFEAELKLVDASPVRSFPGGSTTSKTSCVVSARDGHKRKKSLKRRPLKHLGSLVSRMLKTLSTLANLSGPHEQIGHRHQGTNVTDGAAVSAVDTTITTSTTSTTTTTTATTNSLNPGPTDCSESCSVGAESEDDGGFASFRLGKADRTDRTSLRSASGSALARSASPAPASGSRSGSSCAAERAVPGVSGLRNHGNTCFMNAVLQCLSNTDLLAEFLGLGQYKADLRADSPPDSPLLQAQVLLQAPSLRATSSSSSSFSVAASTNGTPRPPRPHGEVTEQLATLVRALWTLEYTPQLSSDFKHVVARYASQFRGSSQQDAQEFLLWLLDRVHEDLNNSNTVPGTRSPLVVESWSGEENDGEDMETGLPYFGKSFVQELFQAQYRSSLTCPHCQKQSNTFDPFLCISLPIPLRQTRVLGVTVVWARSPRCRRVGLAIPLGGKVARLREILAHESGVARSQLVLTELYTDGFHRSFGDDDNLTTIHEADAIYGFETPPEPSPDGHLSPELPDHVQAEHVLLLLANRCGSGSTSYRFGSPFSRWLARAASWRDLQKLVLKGLGAAPGESAKTQLQDPLFRVCVVVESAKKGYLSYQEPQPLRLPVVDKALKLCRLGEPPHVKLLMEWDEEGKRRLLRDVAEEQVDIADSVREQQLLHQQAPSCNLSDCFHLYTKEEQLAPENAWRCPYCKKLQQGMVKLSLWTLPDILILHLKRFRQVGERRIKLANMVNFPLNSLDMTPHVVRRSQSTWTLLSQGSPWRRPQGLGGDPEDYRYDLYAVCNHHGSLQAGHYTAHCKNSLDGQWYSFDDSSVEPVPEESVCTRSAYILFYQRRSSIPTWSASSSLAGSTCSFLSEHWVNRIPGFERRPSLTSKASTNGTSLPSPHDSPIASQDPLPPNDEDGGFASRPFVRGVQNAEEIPTNLLAPSNQLSVGAASTNGSITPIPCPRQSKELTAAVRPQSRASETRSPTVTAVSTPKHREQKDRVTEPRATSRIRAGKEARGCSGGGTTVGSGADSKVMPRRGWRTTTDTRGRSSTSSEDAIPPRSSTARTKRPASAAGTDIRSSRISHAPQPNIRSSSATPVAAPRRSCTKTEPHTSSTLPRVKEAQLTQKRTLPTPSQRSQVDKTMKKPVAGSTARPKPEPRASTKKQSSFVAPRQLGKWMESRDKQPQSSTGSNGSKPVESANKPVKEESGTKRSDGGRLTLIKSLWRDSKRVSESRTTPQTASRTPSGRKETPQPGPRRTRLPAGDAGKGLVVDKGKGGSTKQDLRQRQMTLGKTACNSESVERVKHESIRGGLQREKDRRTSIGPGWPGRRKNTVPESSL